MHVPDVVRLDRVGGPVDISDKIVLGPGAKMSLEMAAGEEGNGQFDDLVGTDRVSAAQKKLAFGKEEWEEWEKLEDAKREQWEQENTVPSADDVSIALTFVHDSWTLFTHSLSLSLSVCLFCVHSHSVSVARSSSTPSRASFPNLITL